MGGSFSEYVRDAHIAPNVSLFIKADIPDMSEWAKESMHWVANFFLNSVFSGTFIPPMHAYVYNFLRRAQYAYSEHQLARESTLAFIRGGGQSQVGYAEALFHWENFFAQAWNACEIIRTASGVDVFKKGDGSVEERLNLFYNKMKHVESCIASNQMIEGATVPVWLENSGLVSIGQHFSFQETAEVLKNLAICADALMNPTTAKEALDSLDN